MIKIHDIYNAKLPVIAAGDLLLYWVMGLGYLLKGIVHADSTKSIVPALSLLPDSEYDHAVEGFIRYHTRSSAAK